MARQSIDSLTLVRGACPHDCPDTCAWTVGVLDGKAVELKADPDHPFTRGGLCAKVDHFLEDRVYNPDRLLTPLRRTGPKGSGEYEEISLDEALDDIATRLKKTIDEHGSESVLPYSYMGTQGLVQGGSIDLRFFARLKATRLVRAICGATAAAGMTMTNGSGGGIDPEDIVHSKFVILWGTNTQVTNLHLWPFVREAKSNGAKIVVIDPIRTRTAAAADQHVRPMPGTDAALALGMMHVIVRDGLHDTDFIERHTTGFDELERTLADYSPERVERITRIPANEIEQLAREYATTKPALIRALIGMEHHEHGAETFRTITCLPALIGSWRDRGGGMVRTTGYWLAQSLDIDRAGMPELEDPSLREVNMVQFGRALTGLDPPIRALFVYNSNPAAIAPNQHLVMQGLAREDLFTVVLEHFMTDTAKYADYVIPATTQVEHLDLMPSWGHFYLSMNLPAADPPGECIPNTEFFRRLSARMGFTEPYLFETDEQIVRDVLATARGFLDGVTYESLAESGWVKFAMPDDFRPFANGFPSATGKAHLTASYTAAAEGVGGEMATRFPLALVTAKTALHFLNSSYANVPRGLKKEKEPLLDIHPDDATARGITDGGQVRVFNDRASLIVRARVGDRVRPGMVAIPSGWWASHSPGGSSANALTSDGLSDAGGGGGWHDTLVEVAAT